MSDDLKRIPALLTHSRALAHRYRLQLILALRVTVSALSALGLAQVMHLRLPLWAVLTSLIVTQMSLGRSIKVATDYLMGTLAGVAYGGAIAILIPHESEWALFAVLALAIAPLAFIAAFKVNFNVLPITAIIVLLVPGMQHVSPVASALDRVLEVTVGGLVGFIVSFLVFPSRAHAITTDAGADTLELVAAALAQMLEHHTGGERPDIRQINAELANFINRLNATGAEAEHERTARLTTGPATGPLLRTLLRLRHDIVILGRAIGPELPAPVQTRLTPPLRQISAAVGNFLRSSAAALRDRKPPPPLDDVEAAFKAHSEAFDAVRRDGLIRGTPSETAERFFTLGFVLEQIREHLGEVHRVVGEWVHE
ncbi:MAG: FUSC family protein [Bradyrhizobium sp.]